MKIEKHDEYEAYIEWLESQSQSKELPSRRYKRSDRIRQKDLAYESGGYAKVAPTIVLKNEERADAASDFRNIVNSFRKSQGWEEYTHDDED